MRKIQNIFRMKKGEIRNQRGVALIFTLGILGLLTVMALGFASTAMLNQKIASNSAGASSARMLAQVGVQRALTAVALYTADAANNAVGFSDIFSREYGSGKTGNQNTCDFIWKLTTKINDIPLYELPVDYDNKSGVTWQYVTDPSDTTNNTLIGRYAYVVVPYYGALDPSVNYGQSFGTDSTANPDNKLFTVYNIDMDKGISQGLSNLGLSTLGGSAGGTSTLTSKLNLAYNNRFYDLSEYVKRVLGISSEKFNNFKDDKTFEGMKSRLSLFYYLKNIFAVNPYAYPEAYWIDCDHEISDGDTISKDQKRAADHYLHRLSLDALVEKWNDVTDGNYSSIIEKLTNKSMIPDLQYSLTAPDVSDKPIPWFAGWTASSESSDWNKSDKKRQEKQIVANLIQYNLSADKPSVSSAVTDSFTETTVGTSIGPSFEYMGIGRHPYINEIGVEAYVLGVQNSLSDADADGNRTLSYTLKPYLGFGGELINMYDTTFTGSNYTLYFYGRFSFTCKVKSGGDTITWATKAKEDSSDYVLLGSVACSNFSGGYTSMNIEVNNDFSMFGFTTTKPSGVTVDQKGEITGSVTLSDAELLNDNYKSNCLLITGMDVQITKVVLVERSTTTADDGIESTRTRIRDYAELEVESTDASSYSVPTLADSPYHFIKSYQTSDPRVNHYPTDWKKGKKYNTSLSYLEPGVTLTEIEDDGITTVTPGTKNNELLAKYTGKFNGTDYDKETVTNNEIAYHGTDRLSSAMIRHGKMRSLAELGLIHRASPFQTLNLKKARYIKRSKPAGEAEQFKNVGGASYQEGDANILDQLKLRGNDVMKQYGKVNINTASHETLQALFNSIPYQDLASTSQPAATEGEHEIFSNSPVCAEFVAELNDTGKACTNYSSCLACCIINRREVLQFKARSDLMLDLNDLQVWDGTRGNFNSENSVFYLAPKLPGGFTDKEGALKALSASGRMIMRPGGIAAENDWEQEQLIGHLADVTTAEPPDLCIIAIGQTLKDIGGSKVYRNWGMSSIPSIKDDYYSSSDDTYRLYRKAGYIRPGQTNDYLENNQSSSVLGKGILKVADTPISKDKDVELGVYDVGFDKITGESKMIVWVRKDPVTQKWKVVRTMYAE